MKDITTSEYSFDTCGEASKRQLLLSVKQGIDALDALENAVFLIGSAKEPIFSAAMGEQPLEHNPAWLVHHALQTAEAVIYGVIAGMEDKKEGSK
ncbi:MULTISPECIES: DUF3077 domain-containing protein [Pseudomonas aeruginosa group]|uniref:DUF3077 domain-containing protein n=1 Tax=Pseudomonas aeruginosa group TaxID=136841 RepID=UPI001F3CCF33|nr:DUF3077 domain-containing protein [Pseudomonas aeruginosa]MDG3709266.1 DUF3077 domain-containing protein [Pseudomonas aeruginosa]